MWKDEDNNPALSVMSLHPRVMVSCVMALSVLYRYPALHGFCAGEAESVGTNIDRSRFCAECDMLPLFSSQSNERYVTLFACLGRHGITGHGTTRHGRTKTEVLHASAGCNAQVRFYEKRGEWKKSARVCPSPVYDPACTANTPSSFPSSVLAANIALPR